ncbi:MAG: TonB-dependent receptor [Bacteroidetes bacterium]|nr:TonB-dependent receptor [Bacteroidota bacterium]
MRTNHYLQRICLLIISTIVCIGTVKADGIVRGKILDKNNRPIEFATAALVNPKSNTLIKGSASNSTGEFVIDKVQEGNYVLAVSMVGYTKYESEQFVVSNEKEIKKDIVLEEIVHQLKEATVIGKRKFIEQQADKLVINPDASITSASENVYDILKKTPGVMVDNNNNISLKGKEGVKIMIDDKPTYISSDQLASMLKGMQGKDIERIEVIENPSSRYDAEGSSGIINIKTKHIIRRGFNGSVFGGANYSGKYAENAGLNLNMNFGKLNVYGNYTIYGWRGWNSTDIIRKFTSGSYTGATQEIYSKEDYVGLSNNFKVGADYFISKKHVISVMMRGSKGYNNNDGSSVTSFFDTSHKLDSALHTSSTQSNRWKNLTFNTNYKWDIDSTGRSFTIDADLARFTFSAGSSQNGSFFDSQGKNMNLDSKINGYQPAKINIFTVKSDYIHPINKKITLEAGLKTSFVSTNSQADFDVIDPTNTVINAGLKTKDEFKYTENINAAYMSGRGQFGKTAVQLGLRLENTNSNGNSISMNRIDPKHYTNLFPSLFLQQTLNENNQLGFSYSYRIGRPNYHFLNPFIWMLDQYTYNKGNPFLSPQYTHSLGLNYSYNSKFITSIGLNRTNDLFTDVLKQNDETKVLFQTKENLSKSTDINASQTVQLDITKWWNFNTTATVMYKEVSSDITGADNFTRWSYACNTTQSFTLPKDISVELSGRYNSTQLMGNFVINPQFSIDFGVQKMLFNKKGTLKISVDDVFNTMLGGGYAKYGNVDLTVDNHWDTRVLSLSFTYRFGKADFKTRANRSTASSEEQNRSGGNGGGR